MVLSYRSRHTTTMTPPKIAIIGGTAYAGPALEPIPDAAVVLSGNAIEAVGPQGSTAVPPDAELVDAAGLALLPGFIDAHVHIGFVEPHRVLDGGVTTVRDLAWPPELIYPLVRESAADDFRGPTVVAAGPMLTAPRGYPTRAPWAPPGTGLVITGPEEARAAVARLAGDGVAIIKVALNPPVGPTFELPTLRALVDEAHARGLKVTGHVYGLSELEKALEAGMDELAHMLMSPERIPEAVLIRMAEAGMTVVPTLSIFSGRARRIAIDNLRRFAALGGRIVYGTDLGNEGPRPGIDPREVKGMATAGLTSLDIVAAATTVSATWLGLDGIGTLAAGNHADVIAVPAAALEDARRLTDVSMVFRRGVRAR